MQVYGSCYLKLLEKYNEGVSYQFEFYSTLQPLVAFLDIATCNGILEKESDGWNGGTGRPIWSWLACLGLQRGEKKLECGKEVSPCVSTRARRGRNHSSPPPSLLLHFRPLFLPYSFAFQLPYFSCMANDQWRRGNQRRGMLWQFCLYVNWCIFVDQRLLSVDH